MFELEMDQTGRKLFTNNMKPLDIARVVTTGEIIMRSTRRNNIEIFSLSQPEEDRWWDGTEGVEIELLPPGTKITLIVK